MIYRKLNIIIKCNRYSLSLIEGIVNEIIKYKYLIRLNIIIVFNKLRINLDNKDFIIYIITLKVYKNILIFSI